MMHLTNEVNRTRGANAYGEGLNKARCTETRGALMVGRPGFAAEAMVRGSGFGLQRGGTAMGTGSVSPVDLSGVKQLVETTDAVVRESLGVGSRRTEGGKGIDDEQGHCERLAYAATEVAAAEAR